MYLHSHLFPYFYQANRRDAFSPSDPRREQSYNVGNRPMGRRARRERRSIHRERCDEDNERGVSRELPTK